VNPTLTKKGALGVIQAMEILTPPAGRNVAEALRMQLAKSIDNELAIEVLKDIADGMGH